MVVGIGVDIVDIARLATSLAQPHGERLRRRVFTEQEIAYCEEAARKAIGAAVPVRALGWHEVELIATAEGAPTLAFHGRAAELIKQLEVARTHISLSHANEQAIAFVVLERN
jgi:holo-[acyl-carrier protein] synthase